MQGMSRTNERESCESAKRLYEMTVLEEPLSPSDSAFLEQHLTTCDRCGSVHRVMLALPGLAKASIEPNHDGDISLVLRNIHDYRKNERRILRWSASVGIAAAAALVVALLIGRVTVREEIMPAETSITALHCEAVLPMELVSGVKLTHCVGDDPGVTIKDGGVVVSLQKGSVALSVDPKRREKKNVSVQTPQGEVRVKGTLFAVYANDSLGDQVEVFRGVVEVIPQGRVENAFAVSSGFGSRLDARSAYRVSAPSSLIARLDDEIAESHAQMQEHAADSSEEVVQGRTSTENGKETNDIEAEDSEFSRPTLGRLPIQSGRNPASMDTLVAQARACLLTHEWDCAAEKYTSVLKKYSKFPESSAVLISLAKIELRHMNRPNDALVHFETYLKKLPQGPLAEEAVFGIAKSHRKLGQPANETKALRRLISQYPSSSLVGAAQERLRQLENSSKM